MTQWPQLAGPPDWRTQWDELAARSATHSIFQTHAWHECWWTCFGGPARSELRILLAHEGDRLVAVAPLMISAQRVNFRTERVLSFIGTINRSSDYGDFIAPDHDDAIAAFCRWISEHRAEWTLLDLLHVPLHSPHLAVLRRELADVGPTDEMVQFDAPARVFGLDPKDDAQAVNKKSLKRHYNALKKAGNVEFTHLGAEAEAHLEAFYQQHTGRRALAGGHGSLFEEANQREFYRTLTRAMAPRGWLRFGALRLDGQPLAFHFGFEFAGVFTWYKPSFDAAQAHRSPGEVLIKHLLEYCMATGVKEFDFTIGDEAFKYRFANQIRKVGRFRVFRRRTSFAMMRLRRAAGRLRASRRATAAKANTTEKADKE